MSADPRQREFVELVQRSQGTIQSLAFRLLRDQDLMDDALQDAYLNAYRAWGSFKGRACGSTWLYRIVHNACVDELRAPGRRRSVPLDDLHLHSASVSDPAEMAALRGDLATALGRLPEAERAAVLLVDGQGLPYREAAEALGIPMGTLATRLARAHRRLRGALGTDQEAAA